MQTTSAVTSSKLILALFCLASAACSSSSGAPNATGGDAAGADGAAVDAGDGCDIPSDDPAATCVRTVSGSVTDIDGAPLANRSVTVCGIICFYAQTAADGSFTTYIDSNINIARFAALAHGRPDYASLYAKLPAAAEHITVAPLRIPKYLDGQVLPDDGAPASHVISGDVTLDIPDNTAFQLDVDDVASPTGRQFRVGAAKASELPDFAKASGAVQLYGLAPFGATSVVNGSASAPTGPTPQKLAVHVKNTSKLLQPNQKVQFFVLGVNLLSSPPTAGSEVDVATGTVSADGTTIDTDAGQGISTISWLGVRKAS